MKVSWEAIVLVVAVGLLNILFNVTVQNAATQQGDIVARMISREFLIAFCVGCASLGALFALYASGIFLGRAILLMGVVSIIGGALVGIAWKKQPIDHVETALLGILAILFVYRIAIKN